MRNLTPVAVLLFTAVSASAKDYAADRYDVRLQFDRQGSLTVTETVVFRFGAGPFWYAYRDIAATETDGIQNVQAWMDERLCPPGTGPGEVEIYGRFKLMVKWHFAQLSNEVHTFTVKYRVAGTLRISANAQTLIWRALPPERDYRIQASDIVLEFPPRINPSAVVLRGRGPKFTAGDRRASVQLHDLRSGERVVVDARFPAAAFASSTPLWQAARDRRENDLVRGVGAAAVPFVVMVTLLLLWMFRIREEVGSPEIPPHPSSPVSTPPDSLAPAVAASLIGKAGWGKLGTILDLARRGLLRIEEAPPGFLRSRRFKIEVLERAVSLAPHEKLVMKSVFRHGQTSVLLSDVAARLASGSGKISSAVRAELTAAGLVDAARSKVRSRLLAIGAMAFIAGLAVLFLGAVTSKSPDAAVFAGSAMTLGVAGMLAGLFGLILGLAQRTRSDAGMIAAARWNEFARHLRQVARGRQPFPDARDLDRFLPYAAAFGIGTVLAKRVKNLPGFALPPGSRPFTVRVATTLLLS